jgi:rhomboid protease GluP
LLITINVILFIAAYALQWFAPIPGSSGRGIMGLLPAPGSVALNLLGWADIRMIVAGSWWVLITAMFLHGGILHILFNMLWIRDLGPQTEMIFGRHGMFIIFVLSGVIGNLVAVFTPVFLNAMMTGQTPYLPVVGASGAVFGLMGAMIAFGRKHGGIFGRQLARQLGIWALVLIVMGFLFPGISNAAHIGGFIGGFVIGRLTPIRHGPGSGGTMVVAAILAGICVVSFVLMVIRLVRILNLL